MMLRLTIALFALVLFAGCSSIKTYPGEKVPGTFFISARGGFSGVTLAHNARSKAEVVAILKRAQAAGARIEKEAQDTFWGGYGGYFSDPDRHYWEVVWGPMFEFTDAGELKPATKA